jgi:DNA polymerase-3 subunit delta
MLKKAKRLLYLISDFKKTKDLEKTINNAKPPIFWKEKEITKQQVNKWTDHKALELIFEINKTELQLKKLPINSINLVTNFLLEKSR